MWMATESEAGSIRSKNVTDLNLINHFLLAGYGLM